MLMFIYVKIVAALCGGALQGFLSGKHFPPFGDIIYVIIVFFFDEKNEESDQKLGPPIFSL